MLGTSRTPVLASPGSAGQTCGSGESWPPRDTALAPRAPPYAISDLISRGTCQTQETRLCPS